MEVRCTCVPVCQYASGHCILNYLAVVYAHSVEIGQLLYELVVLVSIALKMAINVEARSERVRPLPSPTRYPHAILTKPIQSPGIFILEFNNGENRLSVDFLQRTVRSDYHDKVF